MIIHNDSDKFIICSFNHSEITLAPLESLECNEDFDRIRFSITDDSYFAVQDSGKSKILKFLNSVGDPFKLIKDYHLTVVSSYTKEQLIDCHHIILTVRSCDADIETHTYYHFVKVASEGIFIVADDMEIYCKDEIAKDFADNNRKLIRWEAAWAIFVEPILLESISFLLVCLFFSVWLGVKALFAALFFVGFRVIIATIFFLFEKKDLIKRYGRFLDLCNSAAIKENISTFPEY